MDKGEVGIIGAGGQAREVEQYLRESLVRPSFFAIDSDYITDTERQIDILTRNEYERLTPVIAAIGAPAVRRSMIEKWGGEEYYTVLSKDAYIGENVHIGKGSIIAPGVILTTDIEVGEHVLINTGVTVAHNCLLGNYATISPGAHIAGGVRLGEGVFVGIGASISNGITVAEGSVIGAGAVVVSDVAEPNSVVVGVPARLLRINKGWLSEI